MANNGSSSGHGSGQPPLQPSNSTPSHPSTTVRPAQPLQPNQNPPPLQQTVPPVLQPVFRPIPVRPTVQPSSQVPSQLPLFGSHPFPPPQLSPLSSQTRPSQPPPTFVPPPLTQSSPYFQPIPLSINPNSNNPPPLLQPIPQRPPQQLSSLLSTSAPSHQTSQSAQLLPNTNSSQPQGSSSSGRPRANSPGGTLYEREPSPPPNPKKRSRRESAGYDNPSHDHGNMIPLWRKAALSPIPKHIKPGSKAEKDHLMDKKRRFRTNSPGGTDTGDITGHGKGVLGHWPDASSHWNSGGHKQPRKKNQEHNRETSTYHGIEERQHSNASGSQAPRYSSPTPDQGSHPSHWNPTHPDYDPRSAWHTWRPVPSSGQPPSQLQQPTQSTSSQSNNNSVPQAYPPSSTQLSNFQPSVVPSQQRPQPSSQPPRPSLPLQGLTPMQAFQFQPPQLSPFPPPSNSYSQPPSQPFAFGSTPPSHPSQGFGLPQNPFSQPPPQFVPPSTQTHSTLSNVQAPPQFSFSVPSSSLSQSLQPSTHQPPQPFFIPPQPQSLSTLPPQRLSNTQVPQLSPVIPLSQPSSQYVGQSPQSLLPSFNTLFSHLQQPQAHQAQTPLFPPFQPPQQHNPQQQQTPPRSPSPSDFLFTPKGPPSK